MSEKFRGEQDKYRNPWGEVDDYRLVLRDAQESIENISAEYIEFLRKLGYESLQNDKWFLAADIFKAIYDFEGLRQTVKLYLENRPNSAYLAEALIFLEDHEDISNLLNKDTVDVLVLGDLMSSLDKPVAEYIDKYLNESNTPIATGIINHGVDLVAVHNLAKQYDIAIPIARGGLNQGAMADFWGMKTKIIDIAAHNRKVPRGKWISSFEREDFEGKDILLFDKDAVSGATIKKVIKMLASYNPKSLAVYFQYNPKVGDGFGPGTHIDNLPDDIDIYYPNNAPMEKAGDVYMEAHERLGTQYGRRRLMERQFIEDFEKSSEEYPEVSKSLKEFCYRVLKKFDSLNPHLPGIFEVRELMLDKLQHIHLEYNSLLKDGVFNLPNVDINFIRMLSLIKDLPNVFEEYIIRARFLDQGQILAKKRGIENPHLPVSPLGSLLEARKAVKNGYEIALIVGPEGFAYEPYFQDLGIETVAVNIPESGASESRTFQNLDDLKKIIGKKVIIVEDDIRTGATLIKLIEEIQTYKPLELGLYLGQPVRFQLVENIPKVFKETYIAKEKESSPENATRASEEFEEYLADKGLKIYKK